MTSEELRAIQMLNRRTARMLRLHALDAPEVVKEGERRLIAKAIAAWQQDRGSLGSWTA